MKTGERCKQQLNSTQVVDLLGEDLIGKLADIGSSLGGPVYLAGGTVRDLIIGRVPVDIDLTVPNRAIKWASELVGRTGGTYVTLGKDEDAARVVWRGRDIDFSSFREGADTIEEELTKRDITVNSLAVSLDCLLRSGTEPDVTEIEVIDPVGGLVDLDQKKIRATSLQSFKSDPLRLLRVFRFAATLGFVVDNDTFDLVVRQGEWISRPAAERVAHELDLIMGSDRAHDVIGELAQSGILFNIIPELRAGVGLEQPTSHHLDVFDHCLATLQCMVEVQQEPLGYFSRYAEILDDYIAHDRHRVQLRWAALLHDLGKPLTVTIDEDRGGRITFYNHDRAGAELVEEIARRLRWSGTDTRTVAGLVSLHMRPFHLGNVQRCEELSLKACLRLVRLVGPDLPGLFLLSMADALAGLGEGRPDEVEREVATLFARMEDVRREHVEPVRSGPPLLTGQDLIEELDLEPGPLFGKILDAVEEAHMVRQTMSRQEALELARSFQGAHRKGGSKHV